MVISGICTKTENIHLSLKVIIISGKQTWGKSWKGQENYDHLESMGIKVTVVWGYEIKKMMKD